MGRIFDMGRGFRRYDAVIEKEPYVRSVEDYLNGPPLYQSVLNPLPMVLYCPSCGFQHVDNAFWAKKPHRTHMCASCRCEWRPCDANTVGVEKLPTARDESEAGVQHELPLPCGNVSQD